MRQLTMQFLRRFFNGILVLLVVSNFNLAVADDSSAEALALKNYCGNYEANLINIDGAIKKNNYKDALLATEPAAQFSPCLKYLILLSYYANEAPFDIKNNKEMRKVEEAKEINESYKRAICESFVPNSECKAQFVKRETNLFDTLSENCASNLKKINEKMIERREKPVAHRKWKTGLMVSAGAFIASGAILGLTSRYAGSCYSTQNLPSPSDGKDLTCVYPYNYDVGVPILVAAGIGLTIGGAYEWHKAKEIESHIGGKESDVITALCPRPRPASPGDAFSPALSPPAKTSTP